MLTTTKARRGFLRAEGESEDEADTLDYYDSVSDQKQIGPPLFETVSSWSDEVAQTQDFESLVPLHKATGSLIKFPRTYDENEEHSQACQSSSEIVIQLLGTSQSADTVVIVQHEGKYASIRCFRGGDIDRPSSTVGTFSPMGRRLPLVPTSKPKHVVESYEATNRSPV